MVVRAGLVGESRRAPALARRAGAAGGERYSNRSPRVLTWNPCPIQRRTVPRPAPSPSTGGLPLPRRHGRVIYVGKAKNLRSRLNSYFGDVSACTRAPGRWSPPPPGRVDLVSTEVEALQQEFNWIKQFDPRFNVRYRDDKSYPFLAVTLNEEYPRLQVIRGPSARVCATSVRTRMPGPSARPSTCCCGCSPPAPARPGVQAARPDRPALPARLHRQVLGAVRRPGQRRRAPRIVEEFCDFMAGRTDTMVRQIERR